MRTRLGRESAQSVLLKDMLFIHLAESSPDKSFFPT
jgi:hypothetical protein